MQPRTNAAGTWEHRTDADDSGHGAWEHRIDRGTVLSSVRRDDGTLLVEGVAAKAGILTYRRADGSQRRELVRADMLERTAGGLGRAPVTLHHPDPRKHPKGVTPENAKELIVGDTDGDVLYVKDGGFVRVRLAVRDAAAVQAVNNGTRELSPGYAVLLGPGGHDPVYGQFDAEQLDRNYNHLSIVDAARGGADVRLYLDDATAICTETVTDAVPGASTPTSSSSSTGSTSTTNLDGGAVRTYLQEIARLAGLGDQRFDSDESLAKACVAALAQRNDAADTQTKKLRDQVAQLTTERDTEKKRADSEKGRADGAEAEAKKLREAEQQRADKAERAELEAVCQELNLDATGKDLKGLRRLVAATELGEEVRADASDDYVQGLVDRAKKTAKTRADGRKAGDRAWDPHPPSAGGHGGMGGPGTRRDSGVRRPAPLPTPATGSNYAARIQARQDGRRHDARGEGGEE